MTYAELRQLQKGAAVVMTEYGKKQGLIGRAKSDKGIVIKTMPEVGWLEVKRDGLKGANTYSLRFWNVIK